MLEFLMNNIATIIVGLVAAAVVLAVVGKLVWDHKRGKHSCSCGCTGCDNMKMCPSIKK